jgi:hypothetical protein
VLFSLEFGAIDDYIDNRGRLAGRPLEKPVIIGLQRRNRIDPQPKRSQL